MEIERIEKVKLTTEDKISLDRVSAIMNDIVRYSEVEDLVDLASDIIADIKNFYEYTFDEIETD